METELPEKKKKRERKERRKEKDAGHRSGVTGRGQGTESKQQDQVLTNSKHQRPLVTASPDSSQLFT